MTCSAQARPWSRSMTQGWIPSTDAAPFTQQNYQQASSSCLAATYSLLKAKRGNCSVGSKPFCCTKARHSIDSQSCLKWKIPSISALYEEPTLLFAMWRFRACPAKPRAACADPAVPKLCSIHDVNVSSFDRAGVQKIWTVPVCWRKCASAESGTSILIECTVQLTSSTRALLLRTHANMCTHETRSDLCNDYMLKFVLTKTKGSLLCCITIFMQTTDRPERTKSLLCQPCLLLLYVSMQSFQYQRR